MKKDNSVIVPPKASYQISNAEPLPFNVDLYNRTEEPQTLIVKHTPRTIRIVIKKL